MSPTSTDAATVIEPSALRWRCDPGVFGALRQEEDPPRLIGQARAIDALRLGLNMDAPGYNIFVCGPSGTGKMSTVRALLNEDLPQRRPLRDFAFVQNFTDPDRPKLLILPAGVGRAFRRQLEQLSKGIVEIVRTLLDAESLEKKRRELVNEIDELEKSLLADFGARCRQEGFVLAQIQMGEIQHIDVLALYKRKPIEIDELNRMAASGEARVPNINERNRKHAVLKDELRLILARLRRAAYKIKEKIRDIEKESLVSGLTESIDELIEAFPHEGVEVWLRSLLTWLADNVDVFKEDEDEEAPKTLLGQMKVNVVVDHDGRTTPPVIFENSPTFTNIFGLVERASDNQHGALDYNDIKAGSLLRADGGYLIINANDATQEPGVWRTLTRVLKTRALEILSPEQFFSPAASSAIKPDPIPVDLKIIAIGDEELYRVLYTNSDDFRRIFKLKAEFDESMERDARGVSIYAHHTWKVVQEEDLLPFEDDAIARLVEYGVRLSGRQDRLSTRFSDLTDALREASHYAKIEGREIVTREALERVFTARRQRHNLEEEYIYELIGAGVLDLQTEGEAVGSANALTVLDMGDHVFGQPCRISATAAPGEEGVLSVEREVRLSGRIHDKGTMLLTAYLRAHYLPQAELRLSATLTFDQLHAGVDGDSASVAETLALLSMLSGVPLSQKIAMTGALDQRGRVQAVGGVNEKIEGFFRICSARGLSGQGVVIPKDNLRDLVLDQEVIAAVEAGGFYIWSAEHVDQVITLLTGQEAGARNSKGGFPKGSFNAKVQAGLIKLSAQLEEAPKKKA
ncbi:AAA family ATPase [Myxococcota bacterium]|nr:AAA family ATPase [Myxococcota bacterium]MBU1432244.1 AAA family ATPase [Myxococcota bacterium]MBU1899999.1 AAA family ATPase [Myxococcota bacterium]